MCCGVADRVAEHGLEPNIGCAVVGVATVKGSSTSLLARLHKRVGQQDASRNKIDK